MTGAHEEHDMLTILIIIVIVLAVGGIPTWGFHSYGWAPSSLGFIVIVILLILLLHGRL